METNSKPSMKDPLKGPSGVSLFTVQFQTMPTSHWIINYTELLALMRLLLREQSAVLSKSSGPLLLRDADNGLMSDLCCFWNLSLKL